MRDDEIIALNILMFAQRWRLHPWLDIKWDDNTQQFSTSIINYAEDDEEHEEECEIDSLEKLNVLLATDSEFYRNVSTLVSIGALEPYDIDVEVLVRIVVDRLTAKKVKNPYPYSMVTGEFSTALDHIYRFDDLEERTGRFALEAIKVFNRLGEWWGEVLEIRHDDMVWSSREGAYVTSDEKSFVVHVIAEDVYRMACSRSVRLTEENFPLFVAAVEDVLFQIGLIDEDSTGFALSDLAAILFCERSGEINDDLSSIVKKALSSQVLKKDFLSLLPSRPDFSDISMASVTEF